MMRAMACRCSSCTAALPRVARFCPRCGVPARRPSGQPLAIVVILAGILIVLSNLTMRAVTVGSTSRILRSSANVMPVPPAPVAHEFSLERNPRLLLDRDLSVRDLRLHGVRLGDPTSRIPGRFVTRRSAEEIHCYDGNAYGCRGRVVSRIVLSDPAILLQIPCGECLNVFSWFGAPDAMEELNGGDRILFTYASRGMSVRWNRRTGRINQIVLSNPR